MEPESTGISPVKQRQRGGKRPNAGRRKQSTPVKRARYQERVLKQSTSRAVLRGKFFRLERKLMKMRDRGLEDTEEYRRIAVEYVQISKFVHIKASEDLCSNILASVLEENAPELMQGDLEGDSSSSEEVLMQLNIPSCLFFFFRFHISQSCRINYLCKILILSISNI